MSNIEKKKENIYSLVGLEKVTAFTFRQTLKNKSFRITLIVFVLMMSLMGPIQYFAGQSGANAMASAMGISDFKELELDGLYIVNNTSVSLNEIEKMYRDLELACEIHTDADEAVISSLGKKEAAILIEKKDGVIGVSTLLSADSEVDYSGAMDLAVAAANHFQNEKLTAAGITDEKLTLVQNGNYTGKTYSEEEYVMAETGEYSSNAVSMSIMAYSIMIMIVVSLSASYIVASINEEKTSKLVEMLLVSVRPLALIIGKVLGMTGYVLLALALTGLGSSLSKYLMIYVVGVNAESYSTTNMINFDIFSQFGIGYGILIGLMIILAIFIFGMFSGVVGSGCTRQEDIQSATGTVMMVVMVGYIGSSILGSMETAWAPFAGALVPPFSIFMAPILFATGRIPLWTFLVSLLIELGLAVLLFVIAAKTYRKMILNDSKKLGFMDVMKMMKE